MVILRQFMYTKFVIVCDQDIYVIDWQDIIWQLSIECILYLIHYTLFIENTSIDSLDFSSPISLYLDQTWDLIR